MKKIVFILVFFLLSPLSSTWASEKPTQIEISVAKEMYDKGVVFIDARSPDSYKRSHISGAVNLSVIRGKVTEASLSKLVTKDQPVVFYCDCSQLCNISTFAALKATELGYQDVYYIKAAISSWTKAGYAIVR